MICAPSAILGIRTLASLVPGTAMLLGAVILIWFPLRGGYLAQVQEQVLALHAKEYEELEQ